MVDAPSLRLNSVSVEFDGVRLFDDLDFELEAGVMTCLLGASGVGKTTLLRCIAGLEGAVTAGSIEASDGTNVSDRIAWMAQDDLLLPWLNVIDNVTLGSRLRSDADSETHDRAAHLLQRVGLADSINQMPHTLSGGMRQRVALARTLMEDRSILLMDEPFAAVDAMTRHRLQELAGELLEGKTTLLVTHDPLEAVRVAHAIYVMSGTPARTGHPMLPSGKPTRNLDDGDTMRYHAQLLQMMQDLEN